MRCRHLPSGELLYSPLERDVHHLTCLECGTSQPLTSALFSNKDSNCPHPEGFQPLFHTLEVFGYCAKSSLNDQRQRPLHKPKQ